MSPLQTALTLFPSSPLRRWPGLAYYFVGRALYEASGAKLFRDRTLHFEHFKVSADVDGRSSLAFLQENPRP